MPVIITLNPASTEITTVGKNGEQSKETLTVAATPNPATNVLYEYNLAEANSLHPASDLTNLFPGLKLKAKREVETRSPVELVRHYRPQPEQGDRLIIKSPGEEHAILHALADAGMLKSFNQLSVLAHEEPMYETSQPAQRTLEWLEEQGFEQQDRNLEDPDWPITNFTRNPLQNAVDSLREQLGEAQTKLRNEVERAQTLEQHRQDTEQNLVQIREQIARTKKQEQQRHSAELEGLKAELAKVKQNHQHSRQALEQEKVEHNATKEALDLQNQQRQDLEGKQAELETERDGLTKRADHAEAENRNLHNQVTQLQQQLSSEASSQNVLKNLQDRMEYLFGQNTLQLEQATNALGQHVSHTAETTARELEAGIALQQLAPGETLNQSGLPKSAALELANQLKTRNYDLIIEMGSGSTTHFIAQSIEKVGRQLTAPPSNQKELSHYVEASEDDLPKRILSFDHNRSRQKKLSDNLANAGLSGYVSLQFTPLVPSQYNGREQLFYDCGTRLQQVAHLFDDRQARIMIMVDIDVTEPGPTPSAALPAVLQYLSAHQLDIVVHVPSQHQLTEQWEKLLSTRGLEHTAAKALGAGQVQHITVNP